MYSNTNFLMNLLFIRRRWYFVFLGVFMTGFAIILLSLLLKISLLISKENEAKDILLTTNNINKMENNLEDSDTIWQRHEIFDSLTLKWNYTEEYLVMMVLSQRNNCVAIGFSSHSTTTKYDFVVGCVKNGNVLVRDYHSESNQELILDEVQDYEAVIGKQNDTHSLFIYKRKLNTCDKFNIEFTANTITLTWNFLEKEIDEISEAKLLPITYNNTILTSLLDVEFPKPEGNIQTTDILLNNINVVSSGTTVYYCKLIKIEKFEKPRHIIGYDKIIDARNEGMIHHMLLMQCYFDTPVQESGEFCDTVKSIYRISQCGVWIAGATESSKQVFFPQHIGTPYGSSEDQNMYFFLEVHFNLPRKHFVLRDNSGFRLYHTEELRPFTTGVLKIGIEVFQLIPPNETEVSNVGVCSADCTKEYIPPEGVKIISYFFHSHQRARKMRLHQIRNGREIAQIVDDNYNFLHQRFRYLDKEIQILPNDTLVMECIYDSKNESVLTTYGLSTEDEMCEIFIQTYPATKIFKCISSLYLSNMSQLMEGIPEFTSTSLLSPRGLQLLRLYGLNHFFWTNREVTIDPHLLRNLYFEGDHDTLCQVKDKEIVGIEKFQDFIPLAEDKTCSFVKLNKLKET